MSVQSITVDSTVFACESCKVLVFVLIDPSSEIIRDANIEGSSSICHNVDEVLVHGSLGLPALLTRRRYALFTPLRMTCILKAILETLIPRLRQNCHPEEAWV